MSPTKQALRTAVVVRDKLRSARSLETALTQQFPGAGPDDLLRYNACGDPYGCGCGSTTFAALRWQIDAYKKTLATLPHIPNKQERKAARRARAQNKPERRKR